MRHTPNLNLTVWDSNADPFNHTELAANWDAIDADYTRPRPTNQAELLAILPVTGNFNGRLVYLTAASGGFSAGSLLRYQGAGWGVVGPLEVLSAVPASGNFAGRVVLLSAANGGFAAWSLIRYDGTSWATTSREYEILSAVPLTGNFAGRMVLLSAADSGFSAWSLIFFNGTAWKLIGPQPIFPGTELAYYSQSTDLSTTNAVDPGDTITTFSAATFENVKYYFEATLPALVHTVANATVTFRLRDTGANVGNPLVFDTAGTPGRRSSSVARLPFTPSAGAHTYNVNWFVNTAGTATLLATGVVPPVFRIFKA